MEQVKDLLGNLNEMQPTNIKICEKHNEEYRALFGKPWYCNSCKLEEEAENDKLFEEHKYKMVLAEVERIKESDLSEYCVPKRFSKSQLSDFNNAYNLSNNSIFITGLCGSGKTHLAVALMRKYAETNGSIGINRALERSVFIKKQDNMFYNFQSIAILLKSSFGTKEYTMEDVIAKCQNKNFAIFDDICSNKPTDTAIEGLYSIVNSRYEDERMTIYTTNLSLGEISTIYGDRIASRLSACTQIKLNGNDRRLQK